MRQFTKKGKEYIVSDQQVLFNPIVVRWKEKGDTNDPHWWMDHNGLLKLLKQNDWWEITIVPALPTESMGELAIVHNKYIRPWSLAPDWQLHRGFSIRDAQGKLTGCTDKTFDTADDQEHMLFIGQQRLEEIIKGEEVK